MNFLLGPTYVRYVVQYAMTEYDVELIVRVRDI